MKHGRQRWWAMLAAAVLTTSGMAGLPAGAAPTPEPAGSGGSVDAQVNAELRATGQADVWVRFAEGPDLSQFTTVSDWDTRGQAVVDALQAAAASSQHGLRASLDAQGVGYEAFWATNAIRVSAADADLVASMSLAAGVEGIYPTVAVETPEIVPTTPQTAPSTVAWGVGDISSPQVWAAGFEGQDIVVASIDTGVQYDHPALVNQYRGNNGDGTFDHNYSWFDHAGTRPAPADTNGHGTHVTGTMVGSDGGSNQIGVAPGARWIAANGCCPSDAALIASGQWMLAPTDLSGRRPDVSKRPHIINNSWATLAPSNDPFMEDVIEAWAASGQFAVFANGNSGPGCSTSGSPGSRTSAYSVGNYTSSHAISGTSGRGAGQDGTIKPNIAAPGTAVRSSVPGNGYASYNGTSMAAPHVAGAVALAWSASPTLRGDVAATRAALNGTAVDTADLQCGGTPGNNNVFGEGRLDAKALVDAARRVEPLEVQRWAGGDRYGTAVAVSSSYGPGVDVVFLATGLDYPDALSGSALAGALDAPVLLTRHGALPGSTTAELRRLAPGRVVVLGGPGAVSDAVLAQAGAVTGAPVERVAGTDRYRTAAAVAARFGAAERVFVATGANYPDALSAAARAGALGSPVLLVRQDSIPSATAAALDVLAPGQITVLGGEGAVDQSVVEELGDWAPTRRTAGANRWVTSARLFAEVAGAETVYLASGQDWPDALAGSARAGSEREPLLITRADGLPGAIANTLVRLWPERVVVLGGPGAVSETVIEELEGLRRPG